MWPFSFNESNFPAVSVDRAGKQFDANKSAEDSSVAYDYIIVGGGTAGCCLASRLSEDPSVSVLLLERGGINDTWSSRIPVISGDITSKAVPIIRTSSLPLQGAKNQVLDIVHAETLGGGSCVNAMLVTRAANDFNHWASLGHPSWSYTSMKPYFIKSENSLSQTSHDHGYSGPFSTQLFPELPFEIIRKVKSAATALGFSYTTDLNSSEIPVNVCAALDVAIDGQRRRVSSYHAFLPAQIASERKKHLTVCIRAVASRIEFASGVAVGVHFESSDKSVAGKYYARARKEVIVCCGTLGSPQLLLLSGIGASEELKKHDIEIVSDLPGVGSHLQDHVGLPLMYDIPIKDTLHYIENSIFHGIMEFAKYVFLRKGILAGGVTPMAIFGHTDFLAEDSSSALPVTVTETDRPNIEIMTIPHWTSEPPPYKITNGVFSFLLCVVQPKSHGTVSLASRNPHVRPIIDLGFLTNKADYVVFRKGVKLCTRLAEHIRADGKYSMKDFQVPKSDNDEDIDEFIRAEIRTCYHYTSTCRMGKREDGGVVDDELKVYGVQRLRVCDASAFPSITSGHTMAPVIAVAERCADLVKGKA